VGHPVYRRRAARTGGRQVIDLGLQRGDVGGEIDCGVGHVGARFGEGTGSGSLGAGQVGVEGLPGAGDGAVDVGGVLGQLVVAEAGGGQVGITGVVGGADLGGELTQ